MLVSEIVEAGRALENGFVTPDRTILAAATHRIYAVVEKQVMTDGRFDTSRILRAARELSRRAILFDLTRSRKTERVLLECGAFRHRRGKRRAADRARDLRGGDSRDRRRGRGQSPGL